MIDRYHSNEYYSGAQVRVYFGHLLIDEIASIEWAGTSTKRPVYGYASTTFDAVAHGQYLCQGAFLMPFKEVGFLYAVHQSLSNRGAASQRIIDAIKQQNVQAQSVTVTPVPDVGGPSPRARVTTRLGTSTEGTNRVERVVTTLTPEDVLEEEARQGGRSFHDLVESLQETIWDTPGENREPIVRPDEFDLDPISRFVQRGFNILVTFGDVNNPKQPSTVKSLIGVHLTGDQRVIATDGNPIFERYTFFCRATDETLGQYRIIPDRVGAPASDPSATSAQTPVPRKAPEESVPSAPLTPPSSSVSDTTGMVTLTVAERARLRTEAIARASRGSETRLNVTSADTRHVIIVVGGAIPVELFNVTTFAHALRPLRNWFPAFTTSTHGDPAYKISPSSSVLYVITKYAYDKRGQPWYYESTSGSWFWSGWFMGSR